MKKFLFAGLFTALTSCIVAPVAAGSTDCPPGLAKRDGMCIGATGPQGPAGPPGATGPQGEAGATGAQGPRGPAGPKGDTGATGATGTQGPQGVAGVDGTNGVDGVDGRDGTDGKDGSSGPAGSAGRDGSDGKDGKDATTSVADLDDRYSSNSDIAAAMAIGGLELRQGGAGVTSWSVGVGFTNEEEGFALGLHYGLDEKTGVYLKGASSFDGNSQSLFVGLEGQF